MAAHWRAPSCCMGIGEHPSKVHHPDDGPAQHSQGADCRLSASGKCVRVMIVLTPRPARQGGGSPGAVRPARHDMTHSNSRRQQVRAKAPVLAQQSCLAASALIGSSGSCQWRPELENSACPPVPFDFGKHGFSSAGKCRQMLLPWPGQWKPGARVAAQTSGAYNQARTFLASARQIPLTMAGD